MDLSTIDPGIVGALIGAGVTIIAGFLGWLSARRSAQRSDRIEAMKYRRSILMDRAAAQRAALVHVQELSARSANSLTHEAEFQRIHAELVEAFGSAPFAERVCEALDASAQAAAGQPSPNAGLSVMACVTVMRRMTQNTQGAADEGAPSFEDPVPSYEHALQTEQEAFRGLWGDPVNAELTAEAARTGEADVSARIAPNILLGADSTAAHDPAASEEVEADEYEADRRRI